MVEALIDEHDTPPCGTNTPLTLTCPAVSDRTDATADVANAVH